MQDIVIRGGTVYDGSGGEGFPADVAVKDGSISMIGDLSGIKSDKVIDARRMAVTPGFIDMHSHADCSAPMWPDMESALGQGITTCFSGHCGMGIAPVKNYWLEQGFEADAFNRIIPQMAGGSIPGRGRVLSTDALSPAFEQAYGERLDWRTFGEYITHLTQTGHGTNLIANVGHNQLRQQILGYNASRAATPEEVKAMCLELSYALDDGAFGVSFGFDYYSGMYADEDEITALMRVASERNAIVTAHMQLGAERRGDINPDHTALDGFTEFLELGIRTGARLHISHIYPAFDTAKRANGDIGERKAAQASLELIDRYRDKGLEVSWDYLGASPAATFFFPQLATRFRPYVDECGGKRAFAEALKNPWYRDYVANEIRDGRHRAISPFACLNPKAGAMWGANLIINKCSIREYRGKSIEDISKTVGLDCVDTAIKIIMQDPETLCDRRRDTDPLAGHIFVMDEDMTFGTDNGAHNYDFIEEDGADMPYVKGTPTEFGGMVEYFNIFNELSFEAMIKRMTGNAAKILRFPDRGFLREGMRGDILIIDREKLRSNLNLSEPRTAPDGINWVMVNGAIAVENKKHLHPRSGVFIRRKANGI